MQLPRKRAWFDDQVTYLLWKLQVEEGVGMVRMALEVRKAVKGAVK